MNRRIVDLKHKKYDDIVCIHLMGPACCSFSTCEFSDSYDREPFFSGVPLDAVPSAAQLAQMLESENVLRRRVFGAQ